jgi:hypothetical protein
MNVRAERGRGSLRLILAISALAFVLTGCADHQAEATAARQPPATATESFSAYDPSGDLAVKVAANATGTCWTSSIAAPAPDAYRCFAGNAILDPCFARPGAIGATEVACLAAPWSPAKLLTLTAPLPKSDPQTAHRAWAFQLDNGVRCVASTGTVPQVQGINLGYRCTDGRYAGLRDESTRLVRADYADTSAQTVQLVTVTRIWRG